MPDIADLTVYDDAESDIIAWPSDPRGRTINYRMTPERARALADVLDDLPEPEPRNWWRGEIDGLREAARRVRPTLPGSPPSRHANPLPRVRVEPMLRPDRPASLP